MKNTEEDAVPTDSESREEEFWQLARELTGHRITDEQELIRELGRMFRSRTGYMLLLQKDFID